MILIDGKIDIDDGGNQSLFNHFSWEKEIEELNLFNDTPYAIKAACVAVCY